MIILVLSFIFLVLGGVFNYGALLSPGLRPWLELASTVSFIIAITFFAAFAYVGVSA